MASSPFPRALGSGLLAVLAPKTTTSSGYLCGSQARGSAEDFPNAQSGRYGPIEGGWYWLRCMTAARKKMPTITTPTAAIPVTRSRISTNGAQARGFRTSFGHESCRPRRDSSYSFSLHPSW